MSTQEATGDLTPRQQSKLVTLLKQVEAAETAKQAVWLDQESRDDVREIRQAIEDE